MTTTADFDRPVTARPRPGGHKKRRGAGEEVMPNAGSAPNPPDVAPAGGEQVQTPPAEFLAEHVQVQPLPAAVVPRETAELEAEWARRQAAKPVGAMTDEELAAELARRRGAPVQAAGSVPMSGGSMAVPPPSANDTRIEGDLSRPLPQFTADPHAEARRLLDLGNKEPAFVPGGAHPAAPNPGLPAVVAVRQPELPVPVLDEQGALARARPEAANQADAFPVRISEPGSEQVWYEIALPNGGRARVKASDVVVEQPPSNAPAGAPNYRCVSPAPGCPDFYLDPAQVPPGAYPRCPTCGDKRLLPLF